MRLNCCCRLMLSSFCCDGGGDGCVEGEFGCRVLVGCWLELGGSEV